VSTNRSSVAESEQAAVAGQHERMAELFEAAQAGERSALDTLVRELTPLLWQVARAQGLDRDSASDVVQTTWLELLGALHKIHTPVALTGWLVTVARRESWRVRRTGRAEPAEECGTLADPGPAPDESVLDYDRSRRLWAAVDGLPQRCRTLLRVIAFAARPDYVAVSRALGMPVGSIGPTRGRCLAKLRTLLAADPSGGWR
jgi:RNA polymerase sigma factor (sigma-70 family)